MEGCVFCQIINSEVSAHKIFEDEQVIVILDHRPVREGHAMIIPKQHIDNFIDLKNSLAMHICQVGNVIGRKIQSLLKPRRIGFVVAGFGVSHAHYHVIPMWDESDITSSQYATINNGVIEFSMDHIPIAETHKQKELVNLLKILSLEN